MKDIGVRLRLSLWYAAALCLVILLFAIAVYISTLHILEAEMDRSLAREAATLGRVLTEHPDHMQEAARHGVAGLFQVRRRDVVVYRSDAWERAALDPAAADSSATSVWSWRAADQREYRLQVTHTRSAVPLSVVIAQEREPLRRAARGIAQALLFVLPAAVVVAFTGGYFLAGRLLRPIQRMAEQAEQIGAAALHRRVPIPPGNDEFTRMAVVFNTMLNRIEQAFTQLRRFTADAAHELRTPLTAIRSIGEIALQRDSASIETYRDTIASILEELDRLNRTVEELLVLARHDAGQLVLIAEPVAIAPLIEEVIELLRVLIEEKRHVVNVEVDAALTARADRICLRQALINVIDNAVKYTPPQGRIDIVAKNCRGLKIVVSDNGPGIAPPHREQIFHRFYRIDPARSSGDGTGLGLAIARAAIEANGGTLTLCENVSTGACFAIHLYDTRF